MNQSGSSPASGLLSTVGATGRMVAEGLLHLLYPKICWICAEAIPPSPTDFCDACLAALHVEGQAACPRCAASVGPYAAVADGCPLCRDQGFAFDRAVRLGKYAGLLRDIVLRLKQQPGEGLADVMGRFWVEKTLPELRDLNAEVVIPVPLHWRRRWWRGFNQSEGLGAALAAGLRLPNRPRWLRRIRPTPRQSAQTSVTARRENLRDAFAVSRFAAVKGKTVLLVDDVMTTGSTAHEAARALKRAGACVVVAVLARAQGD